ncbi:PLP-dependent aminotransferase family protein [Clostridium manihotivorum]|uniref:PLP-dependent aminotransferase family protein n=1 Tax=Clostridium manihotivorum TaxID=2320868 RepID=A0A410E1H3_9CLOT|nr:PLP-dependent aminotransferase family protein [Clostridium manihotivorum]QAA35167.1 PLP-dependent aminotransferase family protein [Clostridium manihotivorum]
MDNVYKKIVSDIETDIRNGMYKSGQRMPSIRKLSQKYNCSQNTVVKAFNILRYNHIIYSIPQSGYYVVEKTLKNDMPSSSIIHFDTGNPTIGTMNTPDLKHCLDRAVDIYKNNSLNNTMYGVASLRKLLAKYLSDFQIFVDMKNIFVTLGVQQTLSILTFMPFPNNKSKILIEEPTYRHYIDFLKYSKVDVLTIERTDSGLNLKELEKLFKTENIKFFYTIPRNHSPLGTSLSKVQRKAIASLAEKYDVYVVEDDYFGDISSDPKYDPIFSYSDHAHSIYLKSFSKIMPWMRVGLIVVPTKLLEIFQEHIQLSYYSSYFSASLISQATLEIYIRSNILKKHTAEISKELSEKHLLLKKHFKLLRQYDIETIGGNYGFYSYLKLPEWINEDMLIAKLEEKSVLVKSGKIFYYNQDQYKKGIRISIAGVNKETLERGLNIITSVFKQLKDAKHPK